MGKSCTLSRPRAGFGLGVCFRMWSLGCGPSPYTSVKLRSGGLGTSVNPPASFLTAMLYCHRPATPSSVRVSPSASGPHAGMATFFGLAPRPVTGFTFELPSPYLPPRTARGGRQEFLAGGYLRYRIRPCRCNTTLQRANPADGRLTTIPDRGHLAASAHLLFGCLAFSAANRLAPLIIRSLMGLWLHPDLYVTLFRALRDSGGSEPSVCGGPHGLPFLPEDVCAPRILCGSVRAAAMQRSSPCGGTLFILYCSHGCHAMFVLWTNTDHGIYLKSLAVVLGATPTSTYAHCVEVSCPSGN